MPELMGREGEDRGKHSRYSPVFTEKGSRTRAQSIRSHAWLKHLHSLEFVVRNGCNKEDRSEREKRGKKLKQTADQTKLEKQASMLEINAPPTNLPFKL